MKQLPYGISNYEKLIENDYYYVDKTKYIEKNEMLGFNESKLIDLLKDQGISEEEQKVLLPLMKENYDGYKFSLGGKERMYNSNMCLFFLKDYVEANKIPSNLVDVNIASDYSKLSGILSLAKGEKKFLKKQYQEKEY